MREKKVHGAFLQLMPTNTLRSAWEVLLNDTKHDKNSTEDLEKLREHYRNLLTDETFMQKFHEILCTEIYLLQYNCTIDPTIVLGLLNQNRHNGVVSYVIARAPFYSVEAERKEMRIYLGRLDDFGGKTIEQLKEDKGFMLTVKAKIIRAMYEEIEITKTIAPNLLSKRIKYDSIFEETKI